MLNALSIDVEEYFQVSAFESVIKTDDWEHFESRVERNTIHILDMLDSYRTKATFFVLAWVAERQPHLVREIAARGHEVGSHGYAHRRVYTQDLGQFQHETRVSKCILEDIIGLPILGYRAASYSITRDSLWALDVLKQEGFVYDSSIFPIHHDLYGIPEYPRFCHIHTTPNGHNLVEFPISTVRLGRTNIPIGGGGYFRLFPYFVTRWGLRRLNTTEKQPAVVYLHPWEIDPSQPRIQSSRTSRFRHYLNLDKTVPRLSRLLQDFQFDSMIDVLRSQGYSLPIKQDYSLHNLHKTHPGSFKK
jgi:polysaccharide deacetylase family protein (PEP-CTERM system associated)